MFLKKYIVLVLFTLCGGTIAQAQWYFEAGVNSAKFSEFVNLSGNKTTLSSYSGLRDFSYAMGYFFPLRTLEQRLKANGMPSFFRFGLGLGFDQMNLYTQSDTNGYTVPVHYNMAQAQAQGTILLTQPIITKQQFDATVARRPSVFLNLEGGLAYNVYTNAVRTYTTDRGYINDLKNDDKSFVDNYPAFFFGGGLRFSISPATEIYGKYILENAFSTTENAPNDAKKVYKTVKRRVMIGLRLDLGLKSKLNAIQEQRITALEAASDRGSVDLDPLYAKIDTLAAALKAYDDHKNKALQPPKINEETYEVVQHDEGFLFLPDFKHVLFPYGSADFYNSRYEEQLWDLAAFMRENPKLTLLFVGYADSKTGKKAFNKELSRRRAKRVYDHLRKLGIPAHRMSYVGAGETLQFSIGDITKNRRTEIIILNQ